MMQRNEFADRAFHLALSATEPDVSYDDRLFAIYLAIDLLPLVGDRTTKRSVPKLLALMQLVEPCARPSHELRRALAKVLEKDEGLRAVLDELAASTVAARRSLAPPRKETTK